MVSWYISSFRVPELKFALSIIMIGNCLLKTALHNAVRFA